MLEHGKYHHFTLCEPIAGILFVILGTLYEGFALHFQSGRHGSFEHFTC